MATLSPKMKLCESTLPAGDVLSRPTWFQILDGVAASYHDSGSLVADDAVALENERPDASSLPEVNVGPR